MSASKQADEPLAGTITGDRSQLSNFPLENPSTLFLELFSRDCILNRVLFFWRQIYSGKLRSGLIQEVNMLLLI